MRLCLSAWRSREAPYSSRTLFGVSTSPLQSSSLRGRPLFGRPLCPPLLTLRREHIPVGLELRLQDRLLETALPSAHHEMCAHPQSRTDLARAVACVWRRRARSPAADAEEALPAQARAGPHQAAARGSGAAGQELTPTSRACVAAVSPSWPRGTQGYRTGRRFQKEPLDALEDYVSFRRHRTCNRISARQECARTGLMHCNMIGETLNLSNRTSLDLWAQRERPPRGGLSEIRSGVLLRQLREQQSRSSSDAVATSREDHRPPRSGPAAQHRRWDREPQQVRLGFHHRRSSQCGY